MQEISWAVSPLPDNFLFMGSGWVHSLLSIIRDKLCEFLAVMFWQIHRQYQYHKANGY